jgi:hypothetical protein
LNSNVNQTQSKEKKNGIEKERRRNRIKINGTIFILFFKKKRLRNRIKEKWYRESKEIIINKKELKKKRKRKWYREKKKGFLRSSPHSILLPFSQSYVKHDLRKNKIVVPFFC